MNEPPNENDDQDLQRLNQRKLENLLRARAQTNNQAADTGRPIVLNDANFASEVSKYPLMIVDFWAPWCGPCRMVGPIIEQLAKDYAARATFGKLNVDENQLISNQFQVRSIPTILIFKDGRAVDGVVGALPKGALEAKIRPYLTYGQHKRRTSYN